MPQHSQKKRPSWDDYFIGLAYYASVRSPDSQPKVGCVIVSDYRVVGMGYNGFCMGVDDESLPTERPDKYPFMVHAEANAVSNMLINPPNKKVAYITHIPCNSCAKLLWQNGIQEWHVPTSGKAFGYSKDDEIVYNHLRKNGLKINYIEPDLSHVHAIHEEKKNETASRGIYH